MRQVIFFPKVRNSTENYGLQFKFVAAFAKEIRQKLGLFGALKLATLILALQFLLKQRLF